ncbi:MAG TPA: DUF3108 domain-containing protein [Noviherbaspirillum sp.]|nr:DUF3108 domain-containing protein [Noviherbaspirillum sp.]
MIASLFRAPLLALPIAMLSWTLLGAPAATAATKYKVNLPPSAELTYTIKAKQKGMSVEGEGVMRWTADAGKFSVSNEARAMLVGKILDAKSEGTVDAYGLAPATFSEKRFRREKTTTSFDRTANTIRFTASDDSYPIKGGEQDRNSAVWQLISIARAAPAKFKPGTSWTFVVAGTRHAEPWTFKVVKRDKVTTPLGEMNALHIVRMPQPDDKDQQLDIWLAPSLEWYPVRLRFSDDNGDYIEQTLQKIGAKAS